MSKSLGISGFELEAQACDVGSAVARSRLRVSNGLKT